MAAASHINFGSPGTFIAYGTGTAWYVGAGGNDRKEHELNKELIESVKLGFKVGFRHIDCAEVYGTEQEVGVALKQFLQENPTVSRQDFFITTKIYGSLNDIAGGLKNSLSRLGLSYLDLYLIHAPFFSDVKCSHTLTQAWSQMESLVDQGLTRFIGVSNYRIEDFNQFLSQARIKPLCNQIEYHPYLQQPELISFCQKHGIWVTCYSSLAPLHLKTDGPVNAVINKIAKKHNRSEADILFKWVLQKGMIIISTSKQEARLKEYLALDNPNLFKLTDEESKEIDEVGKTVYYRKYWDDKFPVPK